MPFSYFVDNDVLRRVPSLFLLLGGTYLTVQLFACIFLTNPSVAIEHEEASIIEEDNKNGSIRREVILSPLFFALWLTFLFNDQAIMATTGLYKAFGLNFPWMDDDVKSYFIQADMLITCLTNFFLLNRFFSL